MRRNVRALQRVAIPCDDENSALNLETIKDNIGTFYVKDEYLFYQDLELLFFCNFNLVKRIRQMRHTFGKLFPLSFGDMRAKREHVAECILHKGVTFKIEAYLVANKEIQRARGTGGQVDLGLVSDTCILELEGLL